MTLDYSAISHIHFNKVTVQSVLEGVTMRIIEILSYVFLLLLVTIKATLTEAKILIMTIPMVSLVIACSKISLVAAMETADNNFPQTSSYEQIIAGKYFFQFIFFENINK